MALTIRIAVDDSDAQLGLSALRLRSQAMHSVFRNLRPELRRELRAAAQQNSSPEGAWAPRSKATIDALIKKGKIKLIKRKERRKRIKGEKRFSGPLRETVTPSALTRSLGRLPGGVVTKATARDLIAESPVPWAGIHNEGGRAGRGAMIPARQFVFLSDSFLKQAERDFAQFVVDGWKR